MSLESPSSPQGGVSHVLPFASILWDVTCMVQWRYFANETKTAYTACTCSQPGPVFELPGDQGVELPSYFYPPPKYWLPEGVSSNSLKGCCSLLSSHCCYQMYHLTKSQQKYPVCDSAWTPICFPHTAIHDIPYIHSFILSRGLHCRYSVFGQWS